MFLFYKLLHVVAVILFMGNIISGLFWKFHAERANESKAIRQVFDGIIRSDRWFTMPSIIVLLIGGFGAAIEGGYPILSTGWIFWSIVLFTISGFAFSAKVAPLQRQIRSMAMEVDNGGDFDWERYHELALSWDRWGLLAMLTPATAVVLMVLKPAIPGL